MATKKPKLDVADRSPYGWWVASYIERAVWDDEPRAKPGSRCLVWENTIVLKARDRESAYRKANRLGSSGSSSTFAHEHNGRTGHWEFVGLTSLLPIYEKLEDGAEIVWKEEVTSFGKMMSRVKAKAQLEVFSSTRAKR